MSWAKHSETPRSGSSSFDMGIPRVGSSTSDRGIPRMPSSTSDRGIPRMPPSTSDRGTALLSDSGNAVAPASNATGSKSALEQKLHNEQQQRAQDAVRKLQQLVGEIKKQTQQLNVPNAHVILGRTSPKVKEAVKAAQDIAREAHALLKGLVVDGTSTSTQEQNFRKAKQQKLTESLNQCAEAVQVAAKAYYKREEEVRTAALDSSVASTLSTNNTQARQLSPEEVTTPRNMVSLQALDAPAALVDMHGELVNQFTNDVTNLQDDMTSLAHSMRQVAGMVQDQGGVLDDIESNMSNAQEDSARGAEQLVQASQTQRSCTKRLWYILGCVVVLAIILVSILIARSL